MAEVDSEHVGAYGMLKILEVKVADRSVFDDKYLLWECDGTECVHHTEKVWKLEGSGGYDGYLTYEYDDFKEACDRLFEYVDEAMNRVVDEHA